MKRPPAYSRSIRRRVVELFFLLVLVIFVPVSLFIRSWLISSYHKFDEKRLTQSYVSFTFFSNARRQFLETLTRVYVREPAVLACFSGRRDSVAADLVSLKQAADLDMMSVLDKSGRVLGGDLNTEVFETRSPARRQWLASLNSQIVSGFAYDRAGQLWLLAVAPVIIPAAAKEDAGTLVIGMILDTVLLEKLGQEIDADIQLIPRESVEKEPEGEGSHYRASWQELMYGQQRFYVSRLVEERGENVSLSVLLRDIQGDAMALLLLKNWSGAFLWSPRTVVLFAWLVIFSFGFCVYFILRTLGRRVTVPLVQLRGAIRQIASNGNLSQRLVVEADDEVGGLIAEFNVMMQALEEASDKLKRSSAELSALYMDLLDQKKFTSEILSTAPSIVLVLLPDGRVKYVNEAIERIAGFKTEEVIGRNWFENFLPFRIREDVRRAFEEILKGDLTKMRQYENEILAKNGSERLLLWNNSFFMDKEGNVLSILAIGQDISEFKKVENELRQKMRDLERFHKVTMDREKIVMELKKEIAALRAQAASLTKPSS